jgi:hypothetical protein
MSSGFRALTSTGYVVGDWRVRFERDGRQFIITIVRVLPRGRAYDR